MPTLYVSDLDGTLLNRQGALSDSTRQGLSDLLKSEVLFTTASARGAASIGLLFEGLTLPLPVISYDGACLSDLSTQRHEVTHVLLPELMAHLLPFIRQHVKNPIIATLEGHRDKIQMAELDNEALQFYHNDRAKVKDPRLTRIANIDDLQNHQAIYVSCLDREEPLRSLEALLKAEFGNQVKTGIAPESYIEGWYRLTIHHPNALKGLGITTLKEYAELHDVEVVAFGDQKNDLSLFEFADRSYAVGNAVAELKEVATGVIGDHDEDAVVRFIEGEI